MKRSSDASFGDSSWEDAEIKRIRINTLTITDLENEFQDIKIEWETAKYKPRHEQQKVAERITKILLRADQVDFCREWRKSFTTRVSQLGDAVDKVIHTTIANKIVLTDDLVKLLSFLEAAEKNLLQSEGIPLMANIQKSIALVKKNMALD